MSINIQLRRKRKEKGLQVAQIAELLGIARSTYYRYEKGQVDNMPSSILKELCSILETTPQELLGWTNEPEMRVENAKEILSSSEYEELQQFLRYLLYRRDHSEHKRKK